VLGAHVRPLFSDLYTTTSSPDAASITFTLSLKYHPPAIKLVDVDHADIVLRTTATCGIPSDHTFADNGLFAGIVEGAFKNPSHVPPDA
jgi:hypothetical protein